MIMDSLLLFSSGQDLFTPAAGAINSTNVIDLGVTSGIPSSANGGGARDMGVGDNPSLKVMIQAITAFTGGTSLAVAVQGAPDNGSGAEGSYTTMASIPAVLTASLTAGQVIGNISVPRPVPGQAMPRYLKLVYTTVGDFTTGTVTAALVIDRQDSPLYPAGLTISN